MPKVTFLNENVTFEVEPGVTVKKVADDHGINLFRGIWQGANCSGWGAMSGWCGRCTVWTRDPNEKTSPLGGMAPLKTGGRVNGCKTLVTADIEVRTKPGYERESLRTTDWAPHSRDATSKWRERLVKARSGGAAEADEAEDTAAKE